jgi:hypothetical protein
MSKPNRLTRQKYKGKVYVGILEKNLQRSETVKSKIRIRIRKKHSGSTTLHPDMFQNTRWE